MAFAAVLAVCAAGGLALRLPRLELRPLHTDEAVHAVKFAALWQTGRYRYDPNEYHGPTLYYLTLPVVWLSGAGDFTQTSVWMYRAVPALVGGLLVLLPLLLLDGLGRPAAACAALLSAVSPALVFYSRYYIQETLLCAFALLAIGCGWRCYRSGGITWALLCGAAVGLMHATKETSLISFGAMGLALLLTWLLGRRSAGALPGEYDPLRIGGASASRRFGPPIRTGGTPMLPARGDAVTAKWQTSTARERFRVGPGPIAAGAAAAVAVSVVCFSTFFTNPSGPLDSLRAWLPYLDRAGGDGVHNHPWHYYLKLLLLNRGTGGPFWSEGLIVVLALVGAIAAFAPPGLWRSADREYFPPARRLPQFLAIYAGILLVIYSAIPYKTPWCALEFLQPMTLLAGIGGVAIWHGLRARPLRVALGCAGLLSAAHLGLQAYRAAFTYAGSYRNPYVYAQPVGDVVRLSDWIHKLADVHPGPEPLLVQVISDHPWPLPWYLRDLQRVGYWEDTPERLVGDVIVVSSDREARVRSQLDAEYRGFYYGLRPDVILAALVRPELWEAFRQRVTAAPAANASGSPATRPAPSLPASTTAP